MSMSLRRTKMAAKKLKEECKQLKEECKQECKQLKEECKQWGEEIIADRREIAKVVGKVVPLATAGGKIGLMVGPEAAVIGACAGCLLALYILHGDVEDRVAVNAVPPIADVGDLLKNINSEASKKILEGAAGSL